MMNEIYRFFLAIIHYLRSTFRIQADLTIESGEDIEKYSKLYICTSVY